MNEPDQPPKSLSRRQQIKAIRPQITQMIYAGSSPDQVKNFLFDNDIDVPMSEVESLFGELVVVKSYRIDAPTAAKIDKKVKESNLTDSEFYRQVIINEKTSVVQKRVQTESDKRILFLLSKMSNNINQIAHRINGELQNQSISGLKEKTCREILENIHSVMDDAKGCKK